ncbi:hypothetical protein jhhlp_005353 [Lomentospora prolificans]|uniref:Mid2 domain-containing protein n=1 Tax=Lomentospora prolificans TaxID=41688 RepID=A0A2N3N7I8_9PEZI|nr:hypothetical protein jhhlp_005353 [Lomentospora prolificans]
MSIFQTYPNGRPLVTNIGCRIWQAYTIYREIPAETTSSESSITTESKTSATRSQTASSATATETSEVEPTESDNDGSDSTGKSGGESNAWVAGAVIGPIALVALVGALVTMKLRKSKQATPPPENAAMMENGGGHSAQEYWAGKPQTTSKNPDNAHMLYTEEPVVELPGDYHYTPELQGK